MVTSCVKQNRKRKQLSRVRSTDWKSSLKLTYSRGNVVETCCSDSFPRATFPGFFLPMKFSWFEFVRHEAGKNDLNFQCRIVYTALANCPPYNIEMNQYLLRVHQLCTVPATCVLCVHIKELILASPPRNMSPSVSRPVG